MAPVAVCRTTAVIIASLLGPMFWVKKSGHTHTHTHIPVPGPVAPPTPPMVWSPTPWPRIFHFHGIHSILDAKPDGTCILYIIIYMIIYIYICIYNYIYMYVCMYVCMYVYIIILYTICIVLLAAMGKVTHVCRSQTFCIRTAQRSRRLGGWCAWLMVMTWAAVPIPVWDDGRMD